MYCQIKGVHGVVRKVTWKEAWEMVRKGLDDPSGVFGIGLSFKLSL